MVIDAGERCAVRGLIVQGRGHSCQNQKVTRVRVLVAAARDGPWTDCGEYDCHTANEHDKVRVTLNAPTPRGQYVKINPRQWQAHVSMRCGLIVATDSTPPQMTKALEPLRE